MELAGPNYFYLLIPAAFGILMAAFGSIFLYMGWRARRQSASAAQSWTPSPGVVTLAEMRTHTEYSENGPRTSYEPHIEYNYRALGMPYHGDRLAFGANRFGRRQAEEVLYRYPVGASVSVFYDPNNPTESVLEIAPRGDTLFLIVGGVIAAMGLCICSLGVGLGMLVISAVG